ncbi:MAG: helix-turn-helix transcriptional regulator [Caulobacteraceae bacterium]
MRSELRKARINSGFTVEELAGIVGISISFYYKLESGQRNPTIALAGRLAKILGNKVELLFFNDNMDKTSNGHMVKEQLRCAISGCFDKYNICCKVCDIKNCNYKCNFINDKECKHQRLE